MSRKIRVQLEPRLEDVLGFRTVLKARLGLLNRGLGTSAGGLDQNKPAELVFHAAFLDQGRKPERTFEQFATLSGSVTLDEKTARPFFRCEPDADFVYDAPPPSGDKPFRKLFLQYDTASFLDAPEGDAPATKLRLPEDPEGARFLEIGVELRIGGADEGAHEKNDVLDVPLGPIEALTSTVPIDQLRGLARIMSAPHFSAWMMLIYGQDIPDRAYRSLHRALLSEAVEMPPIEIVTSLDGDNVAGYDQSSKHIKVKRQFIKNAEEDPEEAALLMAALIEEFGHYVDDDLRNRWSKVGGDADLDEGALFGYSLCNLGWDIRSEAPFATYLRDAEQVPLRVEWPIFKAALDKTFGPEEQRADDMKDAIEFFGAGRGHGKPGTSFAHQSIEDALKNSFPSDEHREQIYFGNWLRDYSQAITPNTLLLLKLAGAVIDKGLPGTSPGPTRFESDPRGVITELLDLYARAKFKDVPEFRVTKARLGVYRSCEHIDNPHGLTTSPLDPDFDRTPSETVELKIDGTLQMPAYLRGRLPRPAMSAAEYMRGELSAALAAGPTPEGRRRLGQGLHTLEDFFSHTNFCELFLRKFGKTTVEPWVPSVTRDGRTFLPLVSGKFGGDDTAASIFLAIAEILEADKDKKCEAGIRSIGVKMAIMVIRDLRPHIAKQLDAALTNVEEFKQAHPIIFNLICNSLGVVMRFLHWLCGVIARLLANQIDEAQTLTGPGRTVNPTHTQIAKDHDDHPLHALAARCAMVAVKDVGEMMITAWSKAPGAKSEAEILDGAERYFVHPDRMTAVQTPGLIAISQEVERFARDPANAAAIQKASTRTPAKDHLDEVMKKAEEITKSIPIERLKGMFGF